MRDGVRLSGSSATTSGRACSLRGGAALPTSCIRTAPSPYRRPSQLFHLYYLHAPTSTPFSWPRASTNLPRRGLISAIRPCRLLSFLPTRLVQSSSLSTMTAPLDPSRIARIRAMLSRPKMQHYRRASTSRIPSSIHDLQNPPSPNSLHLLRSRHTTSPLPYEPSA